MRRLGSRWAGVAIACVLLLPSAARGGDWSWEVTPYLWGPSVSVDASVNDAQIVSTTVPVSDLIDDITLAGMVHFEGMSGHWGFLVSLDTMSLSDEQTIEDAQLGNGTVVDGEVSLLLAEAGAVYRAIGKDKHSLDLLFGARLADLDLDFDFDFPLITDRSLGSDEALVDGFFGVRYIGKIGGRWKWWLRGDVGAGDTELSWQGIVGFGVGFGAKEQYVLVFGYRHYALEVEEEDVALVETDLTLSGPMIGFAFGF